MFDILYNKNSYVKHNIKLFMSLTALINTYLYTLFTQYEQKETPRNAIICAIILCFMYLPFPFI